MQPGGIKLFHLTNLTDGKRGFYVDSINLRLTCG